MIDFSHANSSKDYRRQAIVCHDVAAQIAGTGGKPGDKRIMGVMIESNLVAAMGRWFPAFNRYRDAAAAAGVAPPRAFTLIRYLSGATATRRAATILTGSAGLQ